MPVQKSQIQVDSIEAYSPVGPVNCGYGASVPAGELFRVNGGISVSGVLTCGSATLSNLNTVGVITASSFSGNGANLTGLPIVNVSKTIAIALLR